MKLFSGLTLMWAGVHLLSAGTTFAMLMSLPTTTFVAVEDGREPRDHDQRGRVHGVVGIADRALGEPGFRARFRLTAVRRNRKRRTGCRIMTR